MSRVLEKVDKRATIQDIARLTGVSVATVSGAFSGKRRMSNQTRETVLSTSRQLGFEINPHAQRLRNGGCANTVGLLSEMDLGVATLTLAALRHRLDECGFKVDDHLLPLYYRQVAADQTAILRSMSRQNPQAILFPNRGLEPEATDVLTQYVEGGGRLVSWIFSQPKSDNIPMAADQVLIDSEDECYRQTRHLLELGHVELGFFSHGSSDQMGIRFNGFKRAMADSKIELRREWLWGEWGYEDAGIKHAERFLALKERPTGVCIINDNAAAAFVHGVIRAGLQVPGDVSVIGCDDLAAARAAIVPLTTMRRPINELSHSIVQLLCDRLAGNITGPPVTREIKSDLVVRSSTAAPRRKKEKLKKRS